MRLSEWTVIQNKDEVFHRYIYGDIEEYREIECVQDEEFDIIDFDQWTIDDCVNLINNLLEDINKHSIGDITDLVKETITEMNMSVEDQQKFMRSFTVKMFERYGY